jgi:hypothetical protein
MSGDRELLIERAWNTYREAVIPKQAPPVQITEMRRAFYAGAHSLLTTIMGLLEPGKEPTENDLRMMHLIEAELTRFYTQVRIGLA